MFFFYYKIHLLVKFLKEKTKIVSMTFITCCKGSKVAKKVISQIRGVKLSRILLSFTVS